MRYQTAETQLCYQMQIQNFWLPTYFWSMSTMLTTVFARHPRLSLHSLGGKTKSD